MPISSNKPELVDVAPVRHADGTTTMSKGFIHPCYVEGCEEYAPFGFRMKGWPLGLWACRGHRAGAEEVFSRMIDRARRKDALVEPVGSESVATGLPEKG